MDYPVPVVRLIVPDAVGRVLLLRRADTTYGFDRWALPGGKIDYGETVEAAAARELEEETGLRCEYPEFLFYQDSLALQPGLMHCINLYFECRVAGDLRLNAESSESVWIGPGDLERFQLVFRNDDGLRQWASMRSA